MTKQFRKQVESTAKVSVWYDRAVRCWKASWIGGGGFNSIVFGPGISTEELILEIQHCRLVDREIETAERTI
jgi:hypothetical protein